MTSCGWSSFRSMHLAWTLWCPSRSSFTKIIHLLVLNLSPDIRKTTIWSRRSNSHARSERHVGTVWQYIRLPQGSSDENGRSNAMPEPSWSSFQFTAFQPTLYDHYFLRFATAQHSILPLRNVEVGSTAHRFSQHRALRRLWLTRRLRCKEYRPCRDASNQTLSLQFRYFEIRKAHLQKDRVMSMCSLPSLSLRPHLILVHVIVVQVLSPLVKAAYWTTSYSRP